jgi:hypothetical protein
MFLMLRWPPEAALEGTQERCASFEAPLPGAPQDEEVGSFRPGSQKTGPPHPALSPPGRGFASRVPRPYAMERPA